jgi:hypothetical protein
MSNSELDKLKFRLAQVITDDYAYAEIDERKLQRYVGGPPKQRYTGGPARFARKNEIALKFIERADTIDELNEFVNALYLTFEEDQRHDSDFDIGRLTKNLAKANSPGAAGYELVKSGRVVAFVWKTSDQLLN